MTKRILNAKPYKNSISAPIIKIGVIAITISMIVMIVSVGVGTGMQKQIKDKISAIEGNLTIQSMNSSSVENSIYPISPKKTFLKETESIEGIKNIEQIISRFGIVRTSEDFDGLYFKGIDSNYDFEKLESFIVQGRIPLFSEKFSNNVIISQILADKLKLKIDDSFQMIFSKSENSKPSIIKLVVSGIYSTGFDELDSKYLYGDIDQIRRILKWNENQISSLEIYMDNDQLYNFSLINRFFRWISGMTNTKGEHYLSEEIYLNSPSDYDVIELKEKYSSIFKWIELFDKNIFAIIFIMIVVASINIISVLVVLILEKTNMIGILKSLGANNTSIRKFFTYTASYLISLGIFLGNLIGLLLLFIQSEFNIISLDSKIYYVDSVPVHVELSQIILLNIIVFIICVLSILIPTFLVSNLNPKDSIKFN